MFETLKKFLPQFTIILISEFILLSMSQWRSQGRTVRAITRSTLLACEVFPTPDEPKNVYKKFDIFDLVFIEKIRAPFLGFSNTLY